MLTKSQLRTQMRPDKPLKVQVWACGILHTAGYKGEQAFTKRNGKQVPLAPNDIIKELHAAAVKYFQEGGIQATEEDLTKLRESKETIRRALSALEDDGIAQRTDDKGQPLSKLTPAQVRKLANGKIRLSFWLKPRNATTKTVEQEWREKTATASVNEVDKNRLLFPPIWKILNVFQIEKPGKSQLSDVQFQQRVTHAYETARAAFLGAMSVDIVCPCPLQTVDAPGLLEVDTPGGAFERKGERKENLHAACSEVDTNQAPEEPPTAILTRELSRRKLTPGPGLLVKILAALQTCPVFYFIEVLDRRAERGAIGTGLLTRIAEDAAREFAAQCSAIDEVA